MVKSAYIANVATGAGVPVTGLRERGVLETPTALGRRKNVPQLLAGPQWVAIVHTLGLSARECDVLKSIFADERTASISRDLGLSEATVHTYRERLFRKLGVRSCAQVVAATFAAYVELNLERTTKLRNRRVV